jgi:hypothetical protein
MIHGTADGVSEMPFLERNQLSKPISSECSWVPQEYDNRGR